MKTTKFNNLRKAALATVATAALVAGTAACGGNLVSETEPASTPTSDISDSLDANTVTNESTVIAAASDRVNGDITSTDGTDVVPAEESAPAGEATPAEASTPTEESTSSGSGSGAFNPGNLPNVGGLSGLSGAKPGPATIAFVIFAGVDGDVRATVTANEGGAGRNDVVSVTITGRTPEGLPVVSHNLVMIDDEVTQTTWSLDHLPLSEGTTVRIEVIDEAGNVTTGLSSVSLMPIL